MTDNARAAEALARALHDECGTQHYIVHGTTMDGDPDEIQECMGHAEDHEEDAAAIIRYPFTDAERAAIVAALLDGHEGVLAGALMGADERSHLHIRWGAERGYDSATYDDGAAAILAALREAVDAGEGGA